MTIECATKGAREIVAGKVRENLKEKILLKNYCF
jgi:hypothetical protein